MASTSSSPAVEPGGMAERIVRSAERMFRDYGYAKTTVADVAQDAGISTAYVYRFYKSKLALCEAVCTSMLGRLTDMLWAEARSTLPAPDRLRRIYVRLCEETTRMLFEEQRLLDIVRVGLNEDWPSLARYKETLANVTRSIVTDGLREGRFRPIEHIDETVRAITATLLLCAHPVLLQEGVNDDNPGRARALADLAIRGLTQPS